MLSAGILFLYLLAPLPDASGEPPPPGARRLARTPASPAPQASGSELAGAPALAGGSPVRRYLMLKGDERRAKGRDRRGGGDAARRPGYSPTR
jgi:hypothetical protein